MVTLVTVTSRTVTSLTLSWKTEEGKNWTYTLDINETKLPVAPGGSVVSITIGSLQPGTIYPFNVTTVFRGLHSTAYENFNLTSESKKCLQGIFLVVCVVVAYNS